MAMVECVCPECATPITLAVTEMSVEVHTQCPHFWDAHRLSPPWDDCIYVAFRVPNRMWFIPLIIPNGEAPQAEATRSVSANSQSVEVTSEKRQLQQLPLF